MNTSPQIKSAKIMHRAAANSYFSILLIKWASPSPAVLSCYAIVCKLTNVKDQKQLFKDS